MAKIKTGIDGLDKALEGGIPEGNLVLLSGGAGTGKSTLALQFLVNGAEKFGERGLYVSTEQNREELAKQAVNFGWDLDALERTRKLKIEYFDIAKEANFLKRMDKLVLEFKPKRITIDSMTTLTDALMVSEMSEETAFSLVQIAESVSPIPKTEQVIAKTILYQLIKNIKKYKTTTLLTTELYEDTDRLSADGISEFITDGVIVLFYSRIGQIEDRALNIRKMRYTKHDRRYLIFDFGKDGIRLKPQEAGGLEL